MVVESVVVGLLSCWYVFDKVCVTAVVCVCIVLCVCMFCFCVVGVVSVFLRVWVHVWGGWRECGGLRE